MKNPNPQILPIREAPCNRCLLGKNPIPDKGRIDQLVRDCDKNEIPFLCHEGTINDEYVVCRSFYNQRKDKWLLFRLSLQLKSIRFVKTKKV